MMNLRGCGEVALRRRARAVDKGPRMRFCNT